MATFKARARALDMLGRQQIAGRPTAINELFKNAHDAYADHVEVDYYRSNGLFVLRDDGLGMTEEDFRERWLVLGTESKIGSVGMPPPPADPDKPRRPIMGEKGIGRLAIAAIGPQVLVLTRAKCDGKLHDLVAAFIHWGLFECPGVNLEEIDFDVKTLPAGTLPDRAFIADMVATVRRNAEKLSSSMDDTMSARILADLDEFDVDPAEIDSYLKEPSLRGAGHGTHFIIKPSSELLPVEIDGEPGDDIASPLVKSLIGFTNTMTPDHKEPRIRANFRDHRNDEVSEELISEGAFFTPDEFSQADHHIAGEFDECGRFSGMVTVYRKEPIPYAVEWRSGRGRPTECGPFRLDIAYVQGTPSESLLPPQEFALMTRKLTKMGGLYIYEDGIRVLPFGNSDYDFLDFERRRSLKASYYFFSYRRLFGVIEISGSHNPHLKEKAGREGFIENKAYRQFCDILRSFFRQVAADFFREGGSQADPWMQTKEQLKGTDKARKEHEARAKQERKAFQLALDSVFSKFGEGAPMAETEALLADIRCRLEQATREADPVQAALSFIETESYARRRLSALLDRYKVDKPVGIGLTPKLQRDWAAYNHEFSRVEQDVFDSAEQRISEMVGALATEAKLTLDYRARVERRLNDAILQARKLVEPVKADVESAALRISQDLTVLAQESMTAVNDTAKRVLDELTDARELSSDDTAAMTRLRMLESEILGVAEEKHELLENVCQQLKSVSLAENQDGIITGINELKEGLEERMIALEEKVAQDFELAQLGMAISVISHEFESTVKAIRYSLRRLEAWADINPELGELYGDIRGSFDHLDGYLTLFTPLNRRLYRQKVEIRGSEILKFLENLFEERLRQESIQLKASRSFLSKRIIGFPSTFYPVFVNLVDNATFWLKDRPTPRIIQLDADGKALIVKDNGPGVDIRDREAIFEWGFTHKPGGRGMGLYISREALREAGFSLSLALSEPDQGAVFRMEPSDHTKHDGETSK